jgi:hypothetical protein
MSKCISCRKPNINEVPASPADMCVDLYEIFDGIWYCEECCVKFGLPVPAKPVYGDWDIN